MDKTVNKKSGIMPWSLPDISNSNKYKVTYLPLSKIAANSHQPRKVFDQEKIDSLAKSIKEDGLISPITVRESVGGFYELVVGERRLRAASQAGLRRIPCIISDMSEKQSASIALTENLLRENLNFFEEAYAIENLLEEFDYTQEEIATKMGLSQSTVANKIRILKLPIKIKEEIISNSLSERHARELLKLDTQEQMEFAIKKIISKNLKVKDTENLINQIKLGIFKKEKPKRKYVIKDIRIFANTINHAVDVMNSSGIQAISQRQESDGFIVYTIKIPKTT